ncbi:MAG: hypothetical protein G01um101448_798, partial [Parcubacteria group bacterium Gr01-1014_48]
KQEYAGYVVVDPGRIISKESNPHEVGFSIEFECFNAGRGVAFNISQPKATGILSTNFRNNKTPLYLTTTDNSFEIKSDTTRKAGGLMSRVAPRAIACLPTLVVKRNPLTFRVLLDF